MDDQPNSTTQNPPANPVSVRTQTEAQPISVTRGAERPVSAYSSEALPEVRTELKEIGVEAVSELPPLDKDLERFGVKDSLQSAPVPEKPSGALKLPMSEQEVKEEITKDKGNISLDITEHGEGSAYVVSSRFFLAKLVLKIMDKVKSLGRK